MLGNEPLVDEKRHLAEGVERLVPVVGYDPADVGDSTPWGQDQCVNLKLK